MSQALSSNHLQTPSSQSYPIQTNQQTQSQGVSEQSFKMQQIEAIMLEIQKNQSKNAKAINKINQTPSRDEALQLLFSVIICQHNEVNDLCNINKNLVSLVKEKNDQIKQLESNQQSIINYINNNLHKQIGDNTTQINTVIKLANTNTSRYAELRSLVQPNSSSNQTNDTSIDTSITIAVHNEKGDIV